MLATLPHGRCGLLGGGTALRLKFVAHAMQIAGSTRTIA
jgi:hypothetical protein